MVPGPDCMEDGRMCPNGIHHAAKGCVMNSTKRVDDECFNICMYPFQNGQGRKPVSFSNPICYFESCCGLSFFAHFKGTNITETVHLCCLSKFLKSLFVMLTRIDVRVKPMCYFFCDLFIGLPI